MRLTKDKTVRCKRRKEKLLHFCLRPVINNRDLSRIEDILAPNIPYRKVNKTVQFATYNRFITSHKLLQYIGSFHKSCCFRSTILIRLIIENHTIVKVIYTKYSKCWPYIINCVCIKMLNHGLNHGFFLLLFKLKPCPIHWIVCELAYLSVIFEF